MVRNLPLVINDVLRLVPPDDAPLRNDLVRIQQAAGYELSGEALLDLWREAAKVLEPYTSTDNRFHEAFYGVSSQNLSGTT